MDMREPDIRDFSEKALLEQHEELMFRIALLRKQDLDIEKLEESELDQETEAFLGGSKERTLKLIGNKVREFHLQKVARRSYPVLLRTAAVLCVCFLLTATAYATVPPFRGKVLELLLRFEEKYTEIKLIEREDLAYDIPATWMGTFFPTYVPDGFVVDRVVSDLHTNSLEYIHSDGRTLVYREYIETAVINLDTESAENQFVTIHGEPGLMSIKNGLCCITWSHDGSIFVVFFSGEASEAMRIAEHVARIKK